MENNTTEKWETIEPGIWKPQNEGDSIVGNLTQMEPAANQMSAKYYLHCKDGLFLIWGCTTLDDKMKFVSIGDKIRITYLGKGTNDRKQAYHKYKVEKAKM